MRSPLLVPRSRFLIGQAITMLRSLETVSEYDVEFCPSCNACFNEQCDRHSDPEMCGRGHADDCELRALLDKLYKVGL